jgi:S1-C subfamily serine protease
MSQPPTENDQPDRIGPRPLDRPQVDAQSQAVFGRPAGVDGAFAPVNRPAAGPQPVAQPPEALATAFGKPADAEGLQRPPGELPDGGRRHEDTFWEPEAERDPWRDPGAGAVLAAPAVAAEKDKDVVAAHPAKQLSVADLLFGKTVARKALITLSVLALLVGATGGLVGWLIGSSGTALTDGSATLSQVEPGVQRAPGSISSIAKNASPAVVSLEVTAGSGGSLGSGVMIDAGGYIVTNNHVVSIAASNPQAKITAVFSDGTRTTAKIVGRDPKTDLAVVKVAVSNPKVIQLGKSSDVAVGDSVVAIGSPLGLSSTVTSGIVSALHRPVVAAGENGDPPVTYDAIQTDAPINHGNSGGALVDSSGALIGINSAIRSGGSDPQGGSIGIGFAIPVDEVKQIAEGLIRHGSVKHPNLGVNVRSVSATSSEGAQIANVTKGGAAEKAGIKEGDVVTKFGSQRIDTAEQLQVAVLTAKIGEKVPMQIVRGGATQTITVMLTSD